MEDRIYKFRGKDIFTGLWRFGDLIHNKGISQEPGKDLYNRVMVGGYEVMKDTVGQFICRKDKNGIEIYDGDIFKLAPTENGTIVNKYQVRVSDYLNIEIRNINYSEKLCFFSNVSNDWWTFFKDEIEVIGNIYDNPELLN